MSARLVYRSERHAALDEHAAMHGIDEMSRWSIPAKRPAPKAPPVKREAFAASLLLLAWALGFVSGIALAVLWRLA